jgi:uncharacterized Fe-S cluster protein YjdI
MMRVSMRVSVRVNGLWVSVHMVTHVMQCVKGNSLTFSLPREHSDLSSDC